MMIKTIAFPLMKNDTTKQIMIDYQYLVYLTALFIKEETEDTSSFPKVMLHFGLFTGLVSATTYKQNRTLFIFFLEYINGIVDNKNYFRQLNFFEVYTPRIIKKDGVFFETKSVLFRDIGVKKYIDFVGFLEEYDHLIQQDDFVEECFGWAKCKEFWSEKKNQNISKRNYLLFDKNELKRNITQEELIFRMDLTTL